MTPGTIWIVGCGNMGGAILQGWLARGVQPSQVTIIDPHVKNPPAGVRVLPESPSGESAPDLVLLAVKPQLLDDVAPRLALHMGAATLLISILAGVSTETLRARFIAPHEIIRVMPNMPAAIGKGMVVALDAGLNHETKAMAVNLLSPLGETEWIADEALFHAVTALSGSGPAFAFRFIEAMAQGGMAQGLSREQALRLAIGTVEGSAALLRQSGGAPEALVEQVRSPNGTTHAGLLVLDLNGQFGELIEKTLAAAARRSEELANAAK